MLQAKATLYAADVIALKCNVLYRCVHGIGWWIPDSDCDIDVTDGEGQVCEPNTVSM